MPDIWVKAVNMLCLTNISMKIVCITQGKGTN